MSYNSSEIEFFHTPNFVSLKSQRYDFGNECFGTNFQFNKIFSIFNYVKYRRKDSHAIECPAFKKLNVSSKELLSVKRVHIDSKMRQTRFENYRLYIYLYSIRNSHYILSVHSKTR